MDELHPSIVLGIVALAGLYAGMAAVQRRRVSIRQAAALAAALATIFVALNGPVDSIADDGCFTAHMLQHLLLALVMPPFLLLATPDWMLRPLLRWRTVRGVAHVLTHPIVAFVLYNGFLAIIHTPPVFEWMVRDEAAHIALHVGLMVTGVVVWWPLLSPLPELPRLTYPAQTLYMFLMLIPMAAVSAPITLASEVLYPWYLEGPHPLGLTALADQVLGGLLMWVGAGLYFMAIFSMMFFRWAQRDDRDEPLVGRPVAPALVRGI